MQRKSFLTCLQNLLIALFIFYAIVLFVPSAPQDYYYEFRYGLDSIVNITTWNVLLFLVLVLSAAKIFMRRVSVVSVFILFTGLYLIIFNFTLSATGSGTNYNYLGFLLLTSVAIFDAKDDFLDKVVAFALIIISLWSLLNIIDFFLGLNLSPIFATRYISVAERSDDLALVNVSLFGQKNAAGAAISFGLLFILHLLSYGEKRKRFFYTVAYIIGFMVLLSTTAMGPILISVAGLLLFGLTRKNDGKSFPIIVFSVAIIVIAIYYSVDIIEFVIYKGDAGFTRYQRTIAFLDYIYSNPVVFFMGESISRTAGDEKFYVESAFLDVWLNFGVLGPIIVAFIIAVGFMLAVKSRNRFAVHVILLFFTLIFVQNSSLMPANVVVLLVIYKNLYQEGRRKAMDMDCINPDRSLVSPA